MAAAVAAPAAPAPNPLVQALGAQLAKFPTLDPRAVLAVSQMEGLGGGIGDNGTSFGPFQLHYGGAYPSFAPQGNPQASQAWAVSPAGIDYALRQIQAVAGGLHGQPAISNTVSRFERPANIPKEIAGADQAYGGITPQQYPVALALAQRGAPAAPAPGAAPVAPLAPQAPVAPVRPRANPLLQLALSILNS